LANSVGGSFESDEMCKLFACIGNPYRSSVLAGVLDRCETRVKVGCGIFGRRPRSTQARCHLDQIGIGTAVELSNRAEKLRMVIDGRALVADHGPRAMPVWGERYQSLTSEAGVADTEEEVRTRIEALVQYVESLQEP
jgi:hypothetical protein